MKQIKVLGSGCANCKRTMEIIAKAAEDKGVQIELEKVEDLQAIMACKIMSTPGVVVNGKVVHAGGVPSRKNIDVWLSEYDG